jgi:hypothetical protein
VSEVAAWNWEQHQDSLLKLSDGGKELLLDGKAPRCGEIFVRQQYSRFEALNRA